MHNGGVYVEWPTVQAWFWLEECSGPGSQGIPIVRLSATRGAPTVELAVPTDPRLLILWWAAIAEGHEVPAWHLQPTWVPAWVWCDQEGDESQTYVSLEPVDGVTPRELSMPTSMRGRAAIRRAVRDALLSLTAASSVEGAVAALRPVSEGQPPDTDETSILSAKDSFQLDDRVDDQRAAVVDEPSTGARNAGDATHATAHLEVVDARPPRDVADGHDDWPTLPVWAWLQENEQGEWEPLASLSPTEDVAPLAIEAPRSRAGLVRLWFPVLHSLKRLGTSEEKTSQIPVWLWSEDDDGELSAWFSFERVEGVKSVQVAIPQDESTLRTMQRALGAAMVRATGCDTPTAAARLLSQHPADGKHQQRPSAPPRKPRAATKKAPTKRKPKASAPKRASKPSARSSRKMVVPRIRIVSGGLPGLGKRR